MKKIKVIHIIETLNMGGMEKIVCMFCSWLNKDKFEVEVWALAEGGVLESRAKERGVKFRVMGLKSYHNPLNVIKLASELRKARVDIIHAHGYFCTTFARSAGLLASVPVMIAHLHTTFHSLGPVNRAIDRFLNRFTDRIICVSDAVRDSFFKMGYGERDKFTVIYNGIEEFKYTPVPVETKDKLLFNAASLYPHKGHMALLTVFKAAKERVPGLRLQIAGEGPLLEELRQACQELGIESCVELLGERNDVPALLSHAALFVFPALREGLSLACVEAMASGVPVVAFDAGGLKEVIVDGETGLLCPIGDTAAMCEAVISLIDSPETRSAMGRMARERVEQKFTGARMANRIERLYDNLMTGRGCGEDE